MTNLIVTAATLLLVVLSILLLHLLLEVSKQKHFKRPLMAKARTGRQKRKSKPAAHGWRNKPAYTPVNRLKSQHLFSPRPQSAPAPVQPKPISTPKPKPISTPKPKPIAPPAPEVIAPPVPEPITPPVPEPITLPVPEPITLPVPEPITLPVPEPITPPVPEPITPPVPEPITTPAPAPAPPAPIAPLPSPTPEFARLAVQPTAKLIRLLNGNRAAADRLLKSAQLRNPDRSERWILEKVQWDLERDRLR